MRKVGNPAKPQTTKAAQPANRSVQWTSVVKRAAFIFVFPFERGERTALTHVIPHLRGTLIHFLARSRRHEDRMMPGHLRVQPVHVILKSSCFLVAFKT